MSNTRRVLKLDGFLIDIMKHDFRIKMERDPMKEEQGTIKLLLKRLLFFSLPILVFIYVIYGVIFNVSKDFTWLGFSLYTLFLGVFSLFNYRNKSVEEPVEHLDVLESRILAGRWKILEKREGAFILQPRFDFPYNILSRDKVYVGYSDGIAQIEGPQSYVDSLIKDIKGKKSFWKSRGYRAVSFILVVAFLMFPILLEAGVVTRLRVDYHNYRARSVEKIEIQDADALGNTVNNINNYGYGAEYEEHIFYVEDHLNLVRITKDFQDKTYLIQKSSGSGINRLNIVEGWIFYNSGKTLGRMRTDGTRHEVIYRLGYLTDIHVLGNWIYFISHSDNLAVYRMDVNGENLEKIVDQEVSDLSIHDNRLFYSYGDGKEGFLESSNLEGQDRRAEMGIQVNDLVRWEGYDYFIGHKDYRLYRVKAGGTETPQVLVDDSVSIYFVTDYGLYYTLHSPDAGYPGEGLYRMELDGNGNRKIADARHVGSLSQMEDWILFESWDDTNNQMVERLDIRTEEITLFE